MTTLSLPGRGCWVESRDSHVFLPNNTAFHLPGIIESKQSKNHIRQKGAKEDKPTSS